LCFCFSKNFYNYFKDQISIELDILDSQPGIIEEPPNPKPEQPTAKGLKRLEGFFEYLFFKKLL